MNIFLGDIQFNEIESKFGYKPTEADKKLWDEFYCSSADLSKSDKESCFHLFDMPRCIQFKGEAAKAAIMEMFDSEKLVNPMGKFHVYEV